MVACDDEDDFLLGMFSAFMSKVPKEITFVVTFKKTTCPDGEEKKETASTTAATSGEEEKESTQGISQEDLKELIDSELLKHSSDLFAKLMNGKDFSASSQAESSVTEEFKTIDTSSKADDSAAGVVHTNVSCDGCGIAPIRGIRYKCCICKNFDYCETCEERLGHEHPFLKLRKNGIAPDAMVVCLPEDYPETPDEKAERETPG